MARVARVEGGEITRGDEFELVERELDDTEGVTETFIGSVDAMLNFVAVGAM